MQEIWDGYLRDGTLAGKDLVRGEPIPEGLYHVACSVLVRHGNGSYLVMQRDPKKEIYPGRYEATAGGAALKGETPLACIRRELREETGIAEGTFRLLGSAVREERHSIHYAFLCETDWDQQAITLQTGETVAWYWLSETQFAAFVRSEVIIPSNKERYFDYFIQKGYL